MSKDFDIYEDLEFHDDFARAIQRMENTNDHLFITGKAGTGKSTLLQYFRQTTTKNIAVLAATGVAAVHIKGQTVHSFFKFRPDISLEKVPKIFLKFHDKRMFERLETIVIDEISMVRADLMDCMDLFLRIHGPEPDEPFGGVQIIMIGDLFQLPPVITRQEMPAFRKIYQGPFFFDARCFADMRVTMIELNVVFRQKEKRFIDLLGKIRNNSICGDDLNWLNQRFVKPPMDQDRAGFYIHLTTTNRIADGINQQRLKALDATEVLLAGEARGSFEESRALPTFQNLNLKENAQVMLLNNDPEGRWINGTIGRVVAMDQRSGDGGLVHVELMSGRTVEVQRFTWEMFQYSFNEETQAIDQKKVGSFKQFPLRLAWAVTIHKSQGQTFDRVVLDIGYGTFASGQLYVALSRCTTREGIVLKQRIMKQHIIVNPRVIKFTQAMQDCSLYS